MAFIPEYEIDKLKDKLVTDLSTLGKLYKAKKSSYIIRSVNHSLVEDLKLDGWEEYGNPLITKTRLRKLKSVAVQFEDDIWCQLYDLGYRCLNYDEQFILPYGKDPEDTKQIDVIGVREDSIMLFECKSSEKPRRAPSLKTELEGLETRLNGFRKVLCQMFGEEHKIKYVFATRNLRIDTEGPDILRLQKTNSFFYNDNAFEYVSSLIRTYKSAASYQFLGLLFKDQLISTQRIEVPAIEGDMGGKKYYMFSIEPHLLLKLGFILHKTRANESEMPTYQRLLVPSRLKGITKFIDEGGYFPNSVILNFSQRRHKIQFEHSSRGQFTKSRSGMLKIPNAYAIAYIIDGQHRIYGYANSEFNEKNTIPAVAFVDLDSTEQLEIFMDINQNQKAVSASLRLTLEEDLFWDSDRADSRIKALRSSVIRELSQSSSGPLYSKISVGEDPAKLSFKPFASAFIKSGLLPIVKGNNYHRDHSLGSLYNIDNQNIKLEMERAKKKIVQFINLCYGFVEENYPEIYEKERSFIISNRGSFAFVSLIGSLNLYETQENNLNNDSSPTDRFEAIEKYLVTLLEGIKDLNAPEEEAMYLAYGTGGDIKWLRFFQTIVNNKFPGYEPPELVDWKERQDEELQTKGRTYGVAIEKYVKQEILNKLEVLFNDNWELEINSIKRSCLDRAEAEMEKLYKEFGKKKDIPWTEMFTIMDYKAIIEKYWTKIPENVAQDFITFQKQFSIDIGFDGKKKETKWISLFNSYRNLWAHQGSKDKGLNREEVIFLEKIYYEFYEDSQ